MAEEVTDCTSTSEVVMPHMSVERCQVHKLQTLQRNALCKIFDRPEFTPEEVAMLGYRRLHQAEGIGNKGLAEINAWLKSYGFELTPPVQPEPSRQPIPKRTRRKIEVALRLLRANGYDVQPSLDSTIL